MRRVILWLCAAPVGVSGLYTLLLFVGLLIREIVVFDIFELALVVVVFMLPTVLYLWLVKKGTISRAEHMFIVRSACIQMLALYFLPFFGFPIVWIAGTIVLFFRQRFYRPLP